MDFNLDSDSQFIGESGTVLGSGYRSALISEPVSPTTGQFQIQITYPVWELSSPYAWTSNGSILYGKAEFMHDPSLDTAILSVYAESSDGSRSLLSAQQECRKSFCTSSVYFCFNASGRMIFKFTGDKNAVDKLFSVEAVRISGEFFPTDARKLLFFLVPCVSD